MILSTPVSSRLYTVMALLCALLWASAAVAIKEGIQYSPPLLLMAIRFLIAGAGLFISSWFLGHVFPKEPKLWLHMASVGFFNITLHVGLAGLAMHTISAGVLGLCATINTILLALGGAFFLKETFNRKSSIGLLMAVFGVAGVMSSRINGDNQPIGIFLAIASNVVMVVGNLLFKYASKECSLAIHLAGQMVFGGIFLLLWSWLTESPWHIVANNSFWGSLLYLIFFVSYGAMLLWLWLLAHGSAAQAGAFLCLLPVMGLIFGALCLHEPFFLIDILYSSAIAWGVWLVQYQSQLPEPTEEPMT